MLSIENEYLKVEINPYGGKLSSVFYKKTSEELLWQGEERSWNDKDIVIFPFIARLKDKYYTFNGKRYDMPIHGLACYLDFETAEKTENSIIQILNSNADTLKQYPFDFKLTVKRTLIDKSLITSFTVENKNKVDMPFYLGAHPAYKIDYTESDNCIDTSGNYIVFDKEQQLKQYTLNPTNEFITGISESKIYKKMELTKDLVKNDAVMLKGVNCGVTLVRRNGLKIHFDLSNPPVLAFWSHAAYGGYICIEPWLGLPDTDPSTRELFDKPLINVLRPNGKFNYTFTTTIL